MPFWFEEKKKEQGSHLKAMKLPKPKKFSLMVLISSGRQLT
jgi:hypothetical protein